MEPDLGWTFEQYREYAERRSAQSDQEQRETSRTGLVADPKAAPHGGYRIACTWSGEVTGQAHELSVQLAALLPGTPAYPYDSIHSSIGNLRPPEDRLIDPDSRPDDLEILDLLCDAAQGAVKEVANSKVGSLETTFGPAYLAPRMAYVFGQPEAGYWKLQQAAHAASAEAGVELVGSWGPHLTLTRFGQPAGPAAASRAIELLTAWRTVASVPEAVVVGYYTVSDGSFSVTTYRSFPIG